MNMLPEFIINFGAVTVLASTLLAWATARYVRLGWWLVVAGALLTAWVMLVSAQAPVWSAGRATLLLGALSAFSAFVVGRTRRANPPQTLMLLPGLSLLGAAGVLWAWPGVWVPQAVISVCAAAAGGLLLWATFHANHHIAVQLRAPVLLFTVPIAVATGWGAGPAALVAWPAALAVGWCAVMALHQHLQTVTETLAHELRVADGDLKRALADLAHERAQNSALRQELRQAIAYKSQFLAIMSHELRTPLNAIVGYSELLHNGVYGTITPHQDDRLRKIYRNGTHLLRVISDILDLNKIEAGRLDMRSEEVHVSALVEDLTDQTSVDCVAKGLALHVHISNVLPPLYGDTARLQQVLRHLLSNAVKFTESGHVEVTARQTTVRGGRADGFALPTVGWLADGVWMLLSVADTGIGIAPQHQALIFDEFAQADLGSARAFDGTGLGLAIARKLTALHGGSLWVYSAGVGHGSTFHVALPADKQPIAALHAVAREDVLR